MYSQDTCIDHVKKDPSLGFVIVSSLPNLNKILMCKTASNTDSVSSRTYMHVKMFLILSLSCEREFITLSDTQLFRIVYN